MTDDETITMDRKEARRAIIDIANTSYILGRLDLFASDVMYMARNMVDNNEEIRTAMEGLELTFRAARIPLVDSLKAQIGKFSEVE